MVTAIRHFFFVILFVILFALSLALYHCSLFIILYRPLSALFTLFREFKLLHAPLLYS